MSTPMHMTNCPSEETLAAFIDGRLDPDARQQVVEHVATCEDCYAIVSAAWDFQVSEPVEPGRGEEGGGQLIVAAGKQVVAADGGRVVRGRFGSRAFWASGAAAAVAAAVVAAIVVLPGHLGSNDMNAVVKASDQLAYRPSMARLSADFPYRQKRPQWRGIESGNEQNTSIEASELNLMSVRAHILEAAGKSPSASQLHAMGVASLLMKKVEETENGVSFLEDALRAESKQKEIEDAIRVSQNATLLNDLAAAYVTLLARKPPPNASQVQMRAAAAVNRAWELQKTPQIAWTRAVVTNLFNEKKKTIEAWQDYLKLDPGSDWSREATKELNNVQHPADSTL
jgi:putative zinc finger protein